MRSDVPTPAGRVRVVILLCVIMPVYFLLTYLVIDRLTRGGWPLVLLAGGLILLLLAVAATRRLETRRRERSLGDSDQKKLLDTAIKRDGVLPPAALADRWRPEVDHQLRMLAPGPTIAMVIYLAASMGLARSVAEGETGPVDLTLAVAIGLVLGAAMGPLLNLSMRDRRENLQLLLNQIDVRLDRHSAESPRA